MTYVSSYPVNYLAPPTYSPQPSSNAGRGIVPIAELPWLYGAVIPRRKIGRDCWLAGRWRVDWRVPSIPPKRVV